MRTLPSVLFVAYALFAQALVAVAVVVDDEIEVLGLSLHAADHLTSQN